MEGTTKRILVFLKELKKNNNKLWFDEHRSEYEALRNNWLSVAAKLIEACSQFDDSLKVLEPKKCIFRINRDIRFSADKSPYKTNFGIQLNPFGKATFCGYYLHLEPGNSFVSGGVYMPDALKLAAIRQEIDYNYESFKQIVHQATFKKHFGTLDGSSLTRPPKGYEESNPAISYIKHKDFLATRKFSDADLQTPDFEKQVAAYFKSMYPLVRFLRIAISET